MHGVRLLKGRKSIRCQRRASLAERGWWEAGVQRGCAVGLEGSESH